MTNPPGEGHEPHRDEPPGDGQDQPPTYGQPPAYGEQQPPPYGQDPSAYPTYGQPGQSPYGYGSHAYGQSPGGYPPQAPIQYAPDHPRATTSLVLGILSVVLCQVLGPFAWSIGKKTLNEIDASRGMLGGRGAAQAGYILGVVGTVLLGLVVLYILFMIVVFGLLGTASITST